METVPPKGDGFVTFILAIMMLVICWPTLVTRFAVRMKIKALGLDDWLMGFGMIMVTAWSGILFTYIYSGGGYQPNDPRITPPLASRALKFYFIAQSIYCPTTIPIKFSICVALLRIAGTRRIFKYALWAIMGLTTLAGVGSMVGIVASCSPPSAFWDSSTGKCNAKVNLVAAYFISICSILTDFALAVLPGLILWDVQLKRAIKVSLGIILGLAAFASVATLVRLRYLLALLSSENFLPASAKIAIWTVIELTTGIFAASLPHLRPLLRFIPFLKYVSTHDSAPRQGTTTPRNTNRRDVKMSTFKSSTTAERNRNYRRSVDDGGSQEHILEDDRAVYAGAGIRKGTSITVSPYSGIQSPTRNFSRQFGQRQAL